MKKNVYDIESEVESFHWWFVVRKKLLRKLLTSLDLPSAYLVLDIGCGVGSNLETIKAAGFNVVGLDRSIYALCLIRKKLKFPLINGDLNTLPIKPTSLGLVLALDVLEHLERDMNGIYEIYKILKKGGILILTVPAFKFLWGIQDNVSGHKRRYSRKEVLEKLEQAGFEILRSSYFNFFLFFPILIGRRLIHLLDLRIRSENEINSPLVNLFFKVIFSIELYALKYFPFPFGVSILCIARKGKKIL